MVTPWCVKVTCLPEGSNNDEMAKKFGVDPDTIDVPRNQQGPNYYAWVNGFSSEQHANDFIKKWNNQRIRSGTIKCKISRTKAHVALTRPPLLPRSIGNRKTVIRSNAVIVAGRKVKEHSVSNEVACQFYERELIFYFIGILASMMYNKSNM
jgi:hypothetical protein